MKKRLIGFAALICLIIALSFCCSAVAFAEDTPAESNTEDAYINRLYETFGKEPVDVVDHL